MLLLPVCDTNGDGGRVASGGGGSIASASSLLPHLTDLGTSGAAFPAAELRQCGSSSKCRVFASLYENVKIIECLCVGPGAPVTDLLSPHNLDTDTT